MRGEVVLELTERGAVGTLRNLAFVEVFKVVVCKAVKGSGYGRSGSSVVLISLVQFLDELALGFVYVGGRGVYVVTVAPVSYDIAPIFPAAAYLVDVRSAALCSEFFFESLRHFSYLLLGETNFPRLYSRLFFWLIVCLGVIRERYQLFEGDRIGCRL